MLRSDVEQLVMLPAQRQVFDDLLAVGAERPQCSSGLIDDLRGRINDGIGVAVSRWKGDRIWVSKSLVETLSECEALFVAQRDGAFSGMHEVTAVGIVAHHATQLAYTHPYETPEVWVRAALDTALEEERFAAWWVTQSMGRHSDLIVKSTSKVVSFLDLFPPLQAEWVPRFEESMQVAVGGVLLGARPDLTLGRPRSDCRQSMLLCDLKTGALNPRHFEEAMFYALVATLRFGVPPFRSTVLSLASGEWTDADVTAERLIAAADRVIGAVVAYVDVMTESREASRVPGRYCSWCPIAEACPVAGTSGSSAS